MKNSTITSNKRKFLVLIMQICCNFLSYISIVSKSLLQPHSWYHGPITRINAELKVSLCEGAFLVRDCISSPGNQRIV